MMEVLVFKTDIKTKKKVKGLQPLLNNHQAVQQWSVDTEDIDNVLRVEARDESLEKELILLIRANGFQCEVMPD